VSLSTSSSNPGNRRSDTEFPGIGAVVAERYQVESLLGAGGMGVVLAARHMQLGHLVAIKVMRGSAARDDKAVGRFLREARAAVALSSERVAKVADVGTLPNGAPYMVMEYLSGRDLGEVLRSGGPMAVPVAADAVLQACEAIAEAHSLGIVHRDLKPSNLFLTTGRDGKPLVKVLDFGIATAAAQAGMSSSGDQLTETGMVMGSPAYMSPEQIRNAKAADARSDVWSIGVILYELLTSEAPFKGDTFGETFARILAEDPPPIRRKRPDVPAELERMILQCLERDPKRRVQSVAALAPRLARFAPVDSAPLLGRIAFFAGGGVRTVAAGATAMAPLSSTRAGPEETGGPAWLPSTSPHFPRRSLGATIAMGIAVGGVVLGIGLFVTSRLHGSGMASNAPSATPGDVAAPSRPVAADLARPTPPAIVTPIAETVAEAPPVQALEERVDAGARALAVTAPVSPARVSPASVSPVRPPPPVSHAATAPKVRPPARPLEAPTTTVPDFGY
jgi:predicted Ser/Thr protein kinase